MNFSGKNIMGISLLIIFFAQGCYTLDQVGTPIDEAIEITNVEKASTAKHFVRKKTINHFVYGLVSPDDAGIEKTISDEVRKNNGSSAVNIKMKYQQTFVNGLVAALTMGIYTPFTLTIEGDIVK
jgi:hypothetical protein